MLSPFATTFWWRNNLLTGFLAGYRSVPLKNAYSEELELSALLIHLVITSAKVIKPLYYTHKETQEKLIGRGILIRKQSTFLS